MPRLPKSANHALIDPISLRDRISRMPTLTNINPAQNMYRFYTVRVSRNLFGQWSLLREWGRIGSPGRLRCDTFDSESEAREAERRNVHLRVRHGYYFARE